MAIGPVSLVECMIVLVLVVIVAALAFRVGFFRGRGR